MARLLDPAGDADSSVDLLNLVDEAKRAHAIAVGLAAEPAQPEAESKFCFRFGAGQPDYVRQDHSIGQTVGHAIVSADTVRNCVHTPHVGLREGQAMADRA